jgi:hypothetical protein
MAAKFIIGAPSITGVDANDLVNDFFSDVKFPISIRLHNHLPRNVALPEASVFLKALTGKEEAKIKTFDDLHRLVSSIEQIAELNLHEAAITVEELSLATKPETSKPSKSTPAAPVAPAAPVTETAVTGG